ncbi:VanW family protein [Evansella tamaricis]|uniref:VanW family protein n=1 Tax=Evansella tamaricis TaxID=2069301 RepID=A0ABS6JJD1_9BACI|nr:VanW family protein [Evansella tamaricis]MBU9713643.1 VanW family protein [Evansella tamaricis]
MIIFLVFLLSVSPFSDDDDNLLLLHDGQILASLNRKAFESEYLGNLLIDYGAFKEFRDKLAVEVYEAPENATINTHGQIVPGKDGHILDQTAFKTEFLTYFYNHGPSQLEIPTIILHPKVDSELLATIRVQQISGYTTYFNKKNHERSHNINLASESINNTVVFPNETFSFNEVVGERTLEKGYLPAPVIVKGELFEGVGGGICQVSSTLYNAADRAGVEIIQRYSHSRRVPYVPPGRDATVSWYGPDFTFKNNHNQPLLIRAKAQNGQVVVTIFSSDVINFEPRQVPSAPSKLPEEIVVEL